MMIYVVPTLTKTFKDLNTALPASTQFVITVSDFVSEHTMLFLLGLVAFFGIVFAFIKAPFTQKYFDYIVLRLPVVGTIVKEVNTARTARTLSSLLTSGLDMSKALLITSEVVQNIYYKKIIDNGMKMIEQGLPLSGAFKADTLLYPVMVGEMMEVGEETGNLSSMLLNIAVFYEESVDNRTKDLSTIIEPVLMVFIGVTVGFFAISMITPIYSVMDNVK
jgi:type IV pilus assembly protein PilC